MKPIKRIDRRAGPGRFFYFTKNEAERNTKMEYLIKLLGDYSIGWAITLIAALVFLWLCYRKVEKYFSDKAIHEKEKTSSSKK
ncbi:hypothetical protein [Ruminococcus sp. SR1/5]|uniref:hypothetical protein n=1 Tax=Ruminococcus sp. SR1/5 TaxID=657323 RepID=UPI0001CD5D12|nr:hypothetical protein [Ruminococcus sp. SR1/5]CBL19595.1 hypothetical protein CK1_14760 [Ruminococcus sp. SR1/5]